MFNSHRALARRNFRLNLLFFVVDFTRRVPNQLSDVIVFLNYAGPKIQNLPRILVNFSHKKDIMQNYLDKFCQQHRFKELVILVKDDIAKCDNVLTLTMRIMNLNSYGTGIGDTQLPATPGNSGTEQQVGSFFQSENLQSLTWKPFTVRP